MSEYLLVKRGLYYAPNNQGYTGIKDRAGRYCQSDACEESGVKAIHVDDAPLFSPACFDDVKVEYLLGRIADERSVKFELLEALERCVERVEVDDPFAKELVAKCTAIITRARGETA